MIGVGIGCRAGTAARQIEDALGEALRIYGQTEAKITIIGTIDFKCREPGLLAFADQQTVELVGYTAEQLRAVSDRLLTTSPRVEEATDAPSVAEAAALLTAGTGAALLGPRIARDGVTCALARGIPT